MPIHAVRLIVYLALGSVLAAPVLHQGRQLSERFRAFAVKGGLSFASGSTDMVEIVVERWSTEAETSRVVKTLETGGEKALVKLLQDIRPRVGYVRYLRTDDALPPEERQFNLKYAFESVGEDTRRIVLAAEADLTFPNRVDYPIRVIEMRFGTNGIGEGRLSKARVGFSNGRKILELADYRNGLVCLREIRRQ
jgi:hypothetical protein